jgi:hypothetical protein
LKAQDLSIKQQQEIDAEKELARQQYDENRRRINEEKLRQQLRESNQELRELESKLRAGYVAKGLALQKSEIEARKLQEKIIAQKEKEMLEKARLTNEEMQRKQQEDEWNRKCALKGVLKDQINASYRKKQKLYEEFLKEKEFLDEIVKRIQEEHFEAARQKLELQEKTKTEMEMFKKAKDAWTARQKLELEEENQRIKAYLNAKEAENDEMLKRRLEAEKLRVEINEKMVSELEKAIEESKKRENLLHEIYAAEMDDRLEKQLMKDLEEQLRRRIQIRLDLDRQKYEIACRKENEAELDRLFRDEQMRELAERDKLDQLSDEKRRRKLMEHRRAVQEVLEEKRQRRLKQMGQELKEREEQERQEKRKQDIIEEERIKLLKEHCSALLGFIPPGVLRESDREFIPLPKGKCQ